MSTLRCGPGGLGLRARYAVDPQLHEEVALRLAAGLGTVSGPEAVHRAVVDALGAAVLAGVATEYKRAYRRAVRACWQRWSADLLRHGHAPAAPALEAGLAALGRGQRRRADVQAHLGDLVSGWSYAAAALLSPQLDPRR